MDDTDKDRQADEIVRDVRAGNAERYRDIISLYQRELLTIAGPMLYDREAAKDVVQQAFIKAYFQLDRYRLGTSFSLWLRVIAKNLARDEIRAALRKRKRLAAFREDWLTLAADVWAADQGVESREAALRQCCDRLPLQHRRMLDFRYGERLTVHQIATSINRSPNAIRQALWRLRSALRDCIEKRMAQAG